MDRRKLDRRKFLQVAAASLAAPTVLSQRAFAEAWPTGPVRIVVAFSPGSVTDAVARIVAQRLQEMWGQPVEVEIKPGGGGNFGASMVAKSAPDGATLFLAGPELSTARFLYPSLTYDPLKDFAAVTHLAQQAYVMAVPVASPAKSVQEFIAYAKANPGQIEYASAGVGSLSHLCGELFKRLAGVEMLHLPYPGSTSALQDFLPGRVDVKFENVATILPHVLAGGARGLAVTTAKRIPAAPSLPTVIEAGVPGFDAASWFGIFAPAKTPDNIVAKINKDCVAALAHDSVKPKLLQLGCEIIGSTPEQLAAHLQAETDKWGPVISEAGIKL